MNTTKEEIPILYNLIDFKRLGKRKGVPNLDEIMNDHKEKIVTYWEDRPKLNLGQVLYELRLVPSKVSLVMNNNQSIFNSQGILPREYLFFPIDGEAVLLKDISNELLLKAEDKLESVAGYSGEYMRTLIENELCRRGL